MLVSDKLKELRKQMKKFDLDMYLVTSTDEHNSEYPPRCWQRRAWVSNFSGSNGEALITRDIAYLWTDGRYFLQAEKELDTSHYKLMGKQGSLEISDWLVANAVRKTLGLDPRLVGVKRAKKLSDIMSSIGGKLIFIENNLVDSARIELGESLNLPVGEVFQLHETYSGLDVKEKLFLVQNGLKNSGIDYAVINMLDEIAWLFNIRGNDVEYNPLVISYAVVGKEKSYLFVDITKITNEVGLSLNNCGVELVDYAKFKTYLTNLEGVIGIDENTASFWIFSLLDQEKVKFWESPITLAKAAKNKTEIQGAIKAHVYDAISVVKFLSWLTDSWTSKIDEIIAADKLLEFRGIHSSFKGNSFATISGFAENGSVIHYRASRDTNKKIDDKSLYLIDSGGQYLEGTTDVTRTVHLGEPTVQQKEHYTLVLKGHLALGRAEFPHGTCGEHLDALARLPLWSHGLDYRHGTGHGVGSFLCVHEGPQRISPVISKVLLVPGMIVSNEPGFYLDGNYGIRIENLCLVVEASRKQDSSLYGKFYKFMTLTLVPYCRKLINLDLLSKEEKLQIAKYYDQIRELIRPHLSGGEQIWLDKELAIVETFGIN